MTIRVLVVDDHPLFRDALAAVAAAIPDFEVVGMADSGESGIALAEDGVDVVLMDLGLPGISGIDATRHICAGSDPPAVLVVTMSADDHMIEAALAAGARGYILKGATADEISAAIRTVVSGGMSLGAGVGDRLLTGEHAPAANELTTRENEVFALLADGASNKEIARALGLSLKTVQNYMSKILDKLHLADRTQAALRARDRSP